MSSMNLHEFALRYQAYTGLRNRLALERDQDLILDLVKISSRGVLKKQLTELSPQELKWITIETYTDFKAQYMALSADNKIGTFTLAHYIERLEYELKVVKEMWFNSYVLIVSDFVNWAKEHSIVVWPGRWSAAGSLLARVTKITDVDPLPYGLLFERFLNPARISMPDVDIDFEDTQREKVIEYVRAKYGQENVSAIGTYMQMATKAAFKDAARAIGVPFDRANAFSAIIPERASLTDSLDQKNGSPDLIALYESDEKIKEAAELSKQLEWNMRQLGVHACGIIISPKPVKEYTPLQYVQNNQEYVTQYDGPTLEYIGLLKMDFLWLRNLSVVKNCIKIIKRRSEKSGETLPAIFRQFFIDSSFLPPDDDSYTFEKVFQAGDTTGIFQFEWSGMRRFLVQLKADQMNDLVAMNALYRPGPMEFIPSYIKRKHGEEEVTYMTSELDQILTMQYNTETAQEERKKLEDDLKSILDMTYGIPVYQEQLMFIVQAMAWFSLAEADLLRRWIGKKKKEIIEKLKKEFMERGISYKQYKPETTKWIYEKMIEPAASYSFNKSHSVCYAMIAYQTAYLKAHYPVPFYASLIRSVEEDTDTLSNFIDETQQHGIEVKTPFINESFNHVAAIGDYVRLGFVSIKGIWSDVGEAIQEERKKWWPFKSLEDFLTRCQHIVNKKTLESLTKSWALDALWDRASLVQAVPQLIERSKSTQTADVWLFGGDMMQQKLDIKDIGPTPLMQKLMMEQDSFKAFVSWHPLDWLYPYLKKYNFISQLSNADYTGPYIIVAIIKNIQRAKKKWFFIQIEDLSGKTEFFVKETMDLAKFDIVIIHGYKSRSMGIEKIIKTSRDILVDLANKAGKFDATRDAITVKKSRLAEQDPQLVKDNAATDLQTQSEMETDIDEETIVSEPETTTNSFPLPDKISLIQQVSKIIKKNPGDESISIGTKAYTTSAKGIAELHTLLDK